MITQISHGDFVIFQDRKEAANLIAQQLIGYAGENPLVLAIPRGAAPMAKIIAEALGGELDVVLVHKIGHPFNKEYAIGAVDEKGHIQGQAELAQYGKYAQEEARNQIEELQKRRKLYTPIRPRITPKGRNVIIVDDGIATGWTLKAAITSVRSEAPKTIIAAVAVGPQESIAEIGKLADEIICLEQSDSFIAVSQFFSNFTQVSDEEVIEALKK